MENRRAERLDVNLSAEVYTRSEEIITAGAENLSDEGVCLALSTELPENSVVGVSMFRVDDGIEDPDTAPINVPAKVVWCNRRCGPLILAGMRFVDPRSL